MNENAEKQAVAPDRLAPYRRFFGKPAVVQFAPMPYVQVVPLQDRKGRPETRRLSEGGPVVGLPAVSEPVRLESVATGVVSASDCGNWLIVTEQIEIPKGDYYAGGVGRVEIAIRPESVAFVTMVGEIAHQRPDDSGE